MYTNQMRMTGLSGIDTDSMVKQLMQAESMKLVSLRKSRQINVWKQEQYRDVTKLLQTFQDSFLSFGKATNLKSASSFRNLLTNIKVSGSETASTAISVKPAETKTDANHKLKVEQIATKDIWRGTNNVGGTIRGKEAVDLSSIKEGDSFNISLDGQKAVQIKFDAADVARIQDDQSFEDVMNEKLTALGKENLSGTMTNKVKATVENGKLNITTGYGHTAVISGGARTSNSVVAAAAPEMGTDRTVEFEVTVNSVSTAISVDIAAGDDETAIQDKINAALADQDISDVRAIYSAADGSLAFQNKNNTEDVTISGADLETLGFDDSITLNNYNLFNDLGIPSSASTNLNMKSTLADVFGVSGSVSFKIGGKEFNMDSTYTVERMMNQINATGSGVKMTYDSIRGNFSIESLEVGARNAINFEDPDGFLTNALGLQNEVSAKDAIISLDGTATSRETNSFTIADMDISLTEEAVGKEFTIEVKKDTSKTLEFVKNFVTEYNKLVDSLHDAYGTSRPKSDKYTYYEPLSDDEKEAMKEADIEKYEEKAKEGLLYRDPILSGIASSMRSMLYEPMELENGETISLYEIGITTEYDTSGGYGRIEIDESKLTKALEEHGDDVISLFTQASDVAYSDRYNRTERTRTQGIAYRIEDIIKDATSTNGTLAQKAGIEKTSTVTENELSRMLERQDQKIADMLAMLTNKEDNYYAMFSKLETAMNQANSQMASLQSLLGA